MPTYPFGIESDSTRYLWIEKGVRIKLLNPDGSLAKDVTEWEDHPNFSGIKFILGLDTVNTTIVVNNLPVDFKQRYYEYLKSVLRKLHVVEGIKEPLQYLIFNTIGESGCKYLCDYIPDERKAIWEGEPLTFGSFSEALQIVREIMRNDNSVIAEVIVKESDN